LSVKKGNLQETKVVYEPIEKRSFMGIEVVIGFVPGGSNQVEITQNSNRSIQGGIDVLNGSEKARFESAGARTIDIDNREGSIVVAKGKGGGDGKNHQWSDE
jgi:hypothetical protein